MCSVAALAIAATVASTAVGVYGQEQAGQAAKAQANYKAAVDRNNAILASRAANDARQRGEIAAATQAQQGAQLIGRQKAILASNGVLVNQGSALDLTSATAGQNKLDELTIRNNAEREALGFEAQGMNYNSQSGLDLLAGTSAESAATTQAFGTALSGATSVASKWYELAKPPAVDPSFGGVGAQPY